MSGGNIDTTSAVPLVLPTPNNTSEFSAAVVIPRPAGITIIQAGGGNVVTEAGSAVTFSVALDTAPTSNVVINVTSGNTGEAVVDKSKLTFTPANWNAPQTVTIKGVDDVLLDGDQTTIITLSIDDATSDNTYVAVADKTVSVMTTDDDANRVPQVLAPSGSIGVQRPTFEWTAIANAVSYVLWVDLNGSSNGPVLNLSVTGTSFTPSVNLGIGRYRTWVRAIMPNGSRSSWSHLDFHVTQVPTIQNIPLHSPTRRPTATWDAIEGASGYRLFISNVTAGGSPLVDTIVTGTSYTSATDFDFGLHRIWVRAIGVSDYATAWSVAKDVYIGLRLSDSVQSAFTRRPVFSWESLPGVQSVRLWFQTGNAVVINQSGITANSFTPDTDVPVGDYRWWILPSTATGGKGIWSPPGQINVGGRTRVTSPVGSANSTTPVFAWQSINGAGRYILYVQHLDTGAVVIREDNLQTTTFTPASPLVAGKYRVWVKAIDGSTNLFLTGFWSHPTNFSVASIDKDQDELVVQTSLRILPVQVHDTPVTHTSTVTEQPVSVSRQSLREVVSVQSQPRTPNPDDTSDVHVGAADFATVEVNGKVDEIDMIMADKTHLAALMEI